jgi:hypothetical protein
MNLRLIPVIEFEPSSLGVENFCELQESGLWSAHWNRVLGQMGLRPIRPGSWLVACSEFRAGSAFELLVRVHLTSGATPSPNSIPATDEISPISGGYAFIVDGIVQIEPSCCCDLSDLEAWCAAFREGEGGATPVTIGHGCISLSTDESLVTVTLHSEVAGHQESLYRYPASAFAFALGQADVERRSFATSLKAYLRQFTLPARLDEVVSTLVFGR